MLTYSAVWCHAPPGMLPALTGAVAMAGVCERGAGAGACHRAPEHRKRGAAGGDKVRRGWPDSALVIAVDGVWRFIANPQQVQDPGAGVPFPIGTRCRSCACLVRVVLGGLLSRASVAWSATRGNARRVRCRLLKGAPDDQETPSGSEVRQQVEAFLSQPSDEWPLPVHSVASIKAGAKTKDNSARSSYVLGTTCHITAGVRPQGAHMPPL